MSDMRYPVGQLSLPDTVTDALRRTWIQELKTAPSKIWRAIHGLTDPQLDTPYREGGWTVRQVVHHLPDSHVNGYIRFRLALTEASPVAKTYEEARWAELTDAKGAPVAGSLALLDGLHQRWGLLLDAMSPADFAKRYTTTQGTRMTLDLALGLYAWHGRHHVAHITSLRERMGW